MHTVYASQGGSERKYWNEWEEVWGPIFSWRLKVVAVTALHEHYVHLRTENEYTRHIPFLIVSKMTGETRRYALTEGNQ